MEYKAISGTSLHGAGGLNEKVNNHLKAGYKLHGSISITSSANGDTEYAQALVREDAEGGKRTTRRNRK